MAHIRYIGRYRFRTSETYKLELFVTIVNGFQPLVIVTNFDVAGVLIQTNNIS